MEPAPEVVAPVPPLPTVTGVERVTVTLVVPDNEIPVPAVNNADIFCQEEVVEAPEGAAGNTVNAPKKTVKLETGIEAQVPIFIKEGELVIIDTTTGEYLGRTK